VLQVATTGFENHAISTATAKHFLQEQVVVLPEPGKAGSDRVDGDPLLRLALQHLRQSILSLIAAIIAAAAGHLPREQIFFEGIPTGSGETHSFLAHPSP